MDIDDLYENWLIDRGRAVRAKLGPAAVAAVRDFVAHAGDALDRAAARRAALAAPRGGGQDAGGGHGPGEGRADGLDS